MKYLYRIVNIFLALSIFPVVIFTDLIAFRLGTSVIEEVGLQESISIKFIFDVISGKETFWHEMIIKNSSGSFSWPADLNPIKGYLIAFVAGFALALIACLFIIFWSIFSSKRIPVLIATAAGLISTIVMIACFGAAADMIVDGTINLISALSTGWLAGIVANFVGVDGLMLGGFQNGMIFVFIGLLIWTGSFYLIEIGDKDAAKEKAAKSKK